MPNGEPKSPATTVVSPSTIKHSRIENLGPKKKKRVPKKKGRLHKPCGPANTFLCTPPSKTRPKSPEFEPHVPRRMRRVGGDQGVHGPNEGHGQNHRQVVGGDLGDLRVGGRAQHLRHVETEALHRLLRKWRPGRSFRENPPRSSA